MDFMSDDTLSTHSTMSATTSSGLNSVGSALRTYENKNNFLLFQIFCLLVLVVYIKQKIVLVEHFHLVQYHQRIV